MTNQNIQILSKLKKENWEKTKKNVSKKMILIVIMFLEDAEERATKNDNRPQDIDKNQIDKVNSDDDKSNNNIE